MIIRSVAARAGRRALFVPARQQMCQRALSTETTTPPPTTTSATAEEAVPEVPVPHGRPAWGLRKRVDRPDTIAQDYITMTRLQRKTAKLGSAVEKRYVAGALLKNPPAPKDVTLELLMASQTHMGHNTSLWNPANARYMLGARAGIHIIALEQTAAHLRRAARVVEEVAYGGGLILFVGTRRGQMEIVVRAAELAGACHLFTKWTPGTITNRDQILRKGALRMADERDQTRADEAFFEPHLRDRRPLQPDLVVVLNPLENYVLLHECAVAAIPTIGVIDTDADPTRVTYAIPANDDSLRSVGLVAGVLGRAGELGQKRRLRDAAQGVVTWEVPADVAKYMAQETASVSPSEPQGTGPWRMPRFLNGGKVF